MPQSVELHGLAHLTPGMRTHWARTGRWAVWGSSDRTWLFDMICLVLLTTFLCSGSITWFQCENHIYHVHASVCRNLWMGTRAAGFEGSITSVRQWGDMVRWRCGWAWDCMVRKGFKIKQVGNNWYDMLHVFIYVSSLPLSDSRVVCLRVCDRGAEQLENHYVFHLFVFVCLYCWCAVPKTKGWVEWGAC